jgi:hypothetical protein
MRLDPLTELEDSQLRSLNDAVDAAIAARRDWLDRTMAKASKLQVGDDIYDLNTGRRLGKVVKLYRYWRDRDEGIRDTSHCCDYEFETAHGFFDNTSRQSAMSFGTREEAAERAELRARSLR